MCLLCITFIICRVFVTILQETVLNAFQDVLSSSPMSLKIFRVEGIWDLIFSENFFYSELYSEENSGEIFAYPEKPEFFPASSSVSSMSKECRVNNLQMKVISFLEFAATSNGNSHNLVGSIFLLWFLLFEIFFCPLNWRLKNLILDMYNVSTSCCNRSSYI